LAWSLDKEFIDERKVVKRLLLLRHCCLKATCHNFPVERAAAAVKAKPRSSCPVVLDSIFVNYLLHLI